MLWPGSAKDRPRPAHGVVSSEGLCIRSGGPRPRQVATAWGSSRPAALSFGRVSGGRSWLAAGADSNGRAKFRPLGICHGPWPLQQAVRGPWQRATGQAAEFLGWLHPDPLQTRGRASGLMARCSAPGRHRTAVAGGQLCTILGPA